MEYFVIKQFKTANRKFSAGEKVTASDFDRSGGTSLQDWIDRGFVADEIPASDFHLSEHLTIETQDASQEKVRSPFIFSTVPT